MFVVLLYKSEKVWQYFQRKKTVWATSPTNNFKDKKDTRFCLLASIVVLPDLGTRILVQHTI